MTQVTESTWLKVELCDLNPSLSGQLQLPRVLLRNVVFFPLFSQPMGFFRRLLSAGSKRSKKRSSAKEETQDLRQYHSQTLPVLSEVESEAAANRLLRSASSRLGAMHHKAGDDPLPLLPNRECTSPSCRISLRKTLPVKLILNSTKIRLRLVHYRSFLTVSHLSAGSSSFTHGRLAHPLVSPVELDTLATFSPRKQSLLFVVGSP